MALALIDRLGLYDTIFTDPRRDEFDSVDTSSWNKAYDGLQEIMAVGDGVANGCDPLGTIRSTLLRNSDDKYLPWLLCCFTPWSRVKTAVPDIPVGKAPIPLAATVARKGIKADNKVMKLVDGAVNNLHEITASKDAIAGLDAPNTSPLKRKFDSTGRDDLGMSIRRWGPQWRNHAMYAILVGLMEVEDDTGMLKVTLRIGNWLTTQARFLLLKDYATWLSRLQELELLDAHSLTPLVKGNQLSKALKTKTGPWMKAAMDMAMEWQLRNPAATDPSGAIAEVVRRKEELGLT